MALSLGVFCNGGAFRGAYINGFLRALSKNGIEPDQFVGVSAGFYSAFAHIAEVDDRDLWSEDCGSPIYTDWHKFNVFERFVDFYNAKIKETSPFSEEELVKRMNKKVKAIGTRLWDFEHVLMGDFKSFDDIKDTTLSTGAIPWFLFKFPHLNRDGHRYVDGGFLLKSTYDFLNTDIKVVITPSASGDTTDPGYLGNGVFAYRNDYPDKVKTFLWGSPEDYRRLWDKGYEDGVKFIDDLYKNTMY